MLTLDPSSFNSDEDIWNDWIRAAKMLCVGNSYTIPILVHESVVQEIYESKIIRNATLARPRQPKRTIADVTISTNNSDAKRGHETADDCAQQIRVKLDRMNELVSLARSCRDPSRQLEIFNDHAQISSELDDHLNKLRQNITEHDRTLQLEIMSITAELQKTESAKRRFCQQLEEAEEEMTQLEDQKTKLEEELKNASADAGSAERIRILQEENERKLTMMNDLREQIRSSEAQRDELLNQIETLQAEINQISEEKGQCDEFMTTVKKSADKTRKYLNMTMKKELDATMKDSVQQKLSYDDDTEEEEDDSDKERQVISPKKSTNKATVHNLTSQMTPQK